MEKKFFAWLIAMLTLGPAVVALITYSMYTKVEDMSEARLLATKEVAKLNQLFQRKVTPPPPLPHSVEETEEWRAAENKEPLVITKKENAHKFFKAVTTEEADPWWFSSAPNVLAVWGYGELTPLKNGRAAICLQPTQYKMSPRRCWRVEVKVPPGYKPEFPKKADTKVSALFFKIIL